MQYTNKKKRAYSSEVEGYCTKLLLFIGLLFVSSIPTPQYLIFKICQFKQIENFNKTGLTYNRKEFLDIKYFEYHFKTIYTNNN